MFYVPVTPGGEPGIELPEADAQFPLLESYIDVVVEGGLDCGEEFARELLETTFDWSDYWLNDRELARRPGCESQAPPASTGCWRRSQRPQQS